MKLHEDDKIMLMGALIAVVSLTGVGVFLALVVCIIEAAKNFM